MSSTKWFKNYDDVFPALPPGANTVRDFIHLIGMGIGESEKGTSEGVRIQSASENSDEPLANVTESWEHKHLGPEALELVIEPWGDILRIEAGTTIRVIGNGPPPPGQLEIVSTRTMVTVYGWSGATLRIEADRPPLNRR